MGWLFGWDTRADLIAHLTKPYVARDENGALSYTIEMLAKSVRTNKMWTVVRKLDAAGVEVERSIDLYLLKSGVREGHGYKPVGGEGSCDDSCPIKFLKLVPENRTEWGAEWRASVYAASAKRRAQAEKASNLKAGDVLLLPEGWLFRRFKVTTTAPKVLAVAFENGRTFRIPSRVIAAATIVPVAA